MTDLEKETDENFGTIELDDKFVVFKSEGKEISRFLASDIKIIGERTTKAETYASDWDLIFIVKDNQQIYIPAYANNMDNFLKELGTKLNATIVCTLSSSVDLNSNVIFPKNLAGHKFFDFPNGEPKNIWEKILRFISAGKPIIPKLTNEVKSYLNS